MNPDIIIVGTLFGCGFAVGGPQPFEGPSPTARIHADPRRSRSSIVGCFRATVEVGVDRSANHRSVADFQKKQKKRDTLCRFLAHTHKRGSVGVP